MTIKPKIVISCPIDTKSGYGHRSRDVVRSLFKYDDKYDIKVIAQRWGDTSWGALGNDEIDTKIKNNLIENLTSQPDVFIQITVPNEFQKVGKYNIGITAGMETDICPPSWVQGCNNMDLILTSSEHSKKSITDPVYEQKDSNNPNFSQKVQNTTPTEVLFEGVDVEKYFPHSDTDNVIDDYLHDIKESFAFLFVGHWLKGKYGEDRKNVGKMIHVFLDTFSNTKNPPALILKTSCANTSKMDKHEMLSRINELKKQVKGSLPNIYLIHGDLTDDEMNDLYNNPKVKSMISFTKGEGFGRPLLEFSTSKKPMIVSNWSGHLDFISPHSNCLINGVLKNVDDSALAENLIIKEAKWFAPFDNEMKNGLKDMYKNYSKYIKKNSPQQTLTKQFTLEKMGEKLANILEEKIPKQVELKLPKLIKTK